MRAKILNASAGSGKTYQLAYKYVRDVVEQPSIYRHILAVTFTNKATEEMKSRILKEIHLLASGGESSYLENLCRELDMDAATVRRRAAEVRSKILHDYSRFTVLTIDTFFQRILTAFRNALGNLTARYHQRGKVLRAEIIHHVFQHLVCAGKMIIKRRAVDTGSRNKLRNGDILCGLSVSQLQKGLAYFSFCSGFHAWLLFRRNRGKCPNKCGRPVRENGAVLRVVLARFLRYDGYR